MASVSSLIQQSGKEGPSGIISCYDATLLEKGPPALYQLNTERKYIDNNDRKIRRWTYGKKDKAKQNKVILMVGETDAGKTTLINTMVNHLLGVKFEDQAFYQITEEEQRDQSQSQTSEITVYEVFVEENPTSLTIIDTPGYGDARGFEKDAEIAEYLIRLFADEDGIHYIDTVCFVMKASQNRLSGKELYIFHSVLSLFGRDIQNNIVFLFTHSDGGPPTDALNAIEKAEIPCRRDEDHEPVYFLFNNSQIKKRDRQINRSAWDLEERSLNGFFTILEEKNKKSVQMTLDVLKERRRLEACVFDLNERIFKEEFKAEQLSVILDSITEHKNTIEKCENSEIVVQKTFKEKVLIENEWWWNSKATCCSVCEENCHEWACLDSSPSRCKVMYKQHCTVCSGKCHYRNHVRENKKYVTKTKTFRMTFNELKQFCHGVDDHNLLRFDKEMYEKIKKEHKRNTIKSTEKIEKEIQLKMDLEKITQQKLNLLHEAYFSIMSLSDIALKADSAFTLLYLDFLIPSLKKEEGKVEWVKNLEELKKTGEEQKNKPVLDYVMKFATLASFTFSIHRYNSMDLPPEMITEVIPLRDNFITNYERNHPQLQQCTEKLCEILQIFERKYRNSTEGSRDAGIAGIVGGTVLAAGIAAASAPFTLVLSLAAGGSILAAAGVKSQKFTSEKQIQVTQLKEGIKTQLDHFYNTINPLREKMEDLQEQTEFISKILKKFQQHHSHVSEYFTYVCQKYNIQIEDYDKLTAQMSENTRLISNLAVLYGGPSLWLDMISVPENTRGVTDMVKLAEKKIHEEIDESDEDEIMSKAGKFIIEMRKMIQQFQKITNELEKTKNQLAGFYDTI